MNRLSLILLSFAFIITICFSFVIVDNFRLRKEYKRELSNVKAKLTEKNNQVLILSKKELELKVNYERKDSDFNAKLKELGIKDKRIKDLSKVSVIYKDSIITEMVPIFAGSEIKISDYSDGWNTIHNELNNDSLINVLSGIDSIYLVRHYGWNGWKLAPRFMREKWEKMELINRNPRMTYKINFTSRLK